MRPDGGEARRITDAKDGVGTFAFTPDHKWLAYAAGKTDDQQLWVMPVSGLDSGKATQLTKHPTALRWWKFSPDGRTLFYTASDTLDTDEKKRMEKKFDVKIRNQEEPVQHLWALDVVTRQSKRLTKGTEYTVDGVTLSGDGKYVGFRGLQNDRYFRGTIEANIVGDLYLLELATGSIERLTKNVEIAESVLSFAPDNKTIAFSASNDFTYFRDQRIWLRDLGAKGQPFRKIGDVWDGDATVGFWSADSKTIYFNDGVKATNQLFSIDVASGAVKQLTSLKASLNVQRDEKTGVLLLNYTDATTPPSTYTAASVEKVVDKASWTRLTNPNAQVANFALGEEEEISWKSKDGRMVGGVLIKPVGYKAGTRYPLIVAIHGGPASADLLTFNGGYGAQIYAGAGYAVLMPNYRGSTNYGEKHRIEIAGDYFTKGYNDIMTGVDALVAQGIVDGAQLGVLGWSAGGHWSNWILTHTDRFKAVSTGAGTMNWTSMYAQSDMQRNRQYYMGNKLPYDDFEGYWRQSPLKYIKNAKTPTMIHVVEGDPRVPRPQSEELHMALKRLGVPTEFFVYPGNTHGIPDPRNQYVKSMAEFTWMEKWVRGKDVKFDWKPLLKTLEDAPVVGGPVSSR
jgi:dipeptidyl aminopeptidase/acylaminoacyl peptidase